MIGRLHKGLALIAVGLIVGFVDLYLYLTPREGDTISAEIVSFTEQHPGLILVIGILIGHFWPVSRKDA